MKGLTNEEIRDIAERCEDVVSFCEIARDEHDIDLTIDQASKLLAKAWVELEGDD